MRLIIVDNSSLMLDWIVEFALKEKVLELRNIICINCCSTAEGSMRNKDLCIERAESCGEIIEKLEKLSLNWEDVVLLNVGLFREKEEQMRFTAFSSVKCGEFLKENYPEVSCRFYTVMYGATRLDFVRETNFRWGVPLLLPFHYGDREEGQKKTLLKEIRNLLGKPERIES